MHKFCRTRGCGDYAERLKLSNRYIDKNTQNKIVTEFLLLKNHICLSMCINKNVL